MIPPGLVDGAAPGSLLYDGRRCTIRSLTESDVASLFLLPNVSLALSRYRPGLGGTPQAGTNAVERMRLLRQFEPAVEIEALVLHRSSGAPIGLLCLSSIDRLNLKAEFSVAFFRGRGTRCALEAIHWALDTTFGAGGAEKLIFYTEPDNRPAIALMHALQIDREAVLSREIRLSSGRRGDLWRYALFRDSWQAGVGRQELSRLVPLAESA